MIKKLACILVLLSLGACVSSNSAAAAKNNEQHKALQKQALKNHLYKQAATEKRIIDSLIQAKDPRLKKDEHGAYIRPNRVLGNGTPVYYATNHGRSMREAIKADVIGTAGSAGLNLSGSGIQVGVWDGGHVFAAHDEFTGGPDYLGYQVPIEIADSTEADIWSGHPTGVTSIIIAKGLLHRDDYDVTGVSPQLEKLYSYDWDDYLLEIFDQLQTNNNTDFILSNHSYGFPLLDKDRNPIPDEFIGDYSGWSSALDNITHVYPYYLHIAAGGNDGGTSYPTQEVTGLDQLTGSTTAKNVLTVGSFSMNDDATGIRASNFSSAGPTNDFRIKPEISVLGDQVGVAYWFGNDPEETAGYVVNSGTSFAAPGAAGGIALLQELYQQQNNEYMLGAMVKALICHTATDIDYWQEPGDIPGPDVKTGYGALNLEKAAALIELDATEPNTLTEFTLNEGEAKQLFFIALDEGTLTATLSWFDPNATATESGVTLVNDLDLRINQEDTVYFPYKLPTTNQQATAVKGDNDRDTLEKVSVSGQLGGVYELSITHKDSLAFDEQKAALVVTGPGKFIESKEIFESLTKDGLLIFQENKTLTVATLANDNPFRSVQLFDLSGRLVLQKSKGVFSLGSFSFSTSSVSSGIYVVQVEMAKKTIFRKLILK
jgi:hypothetical protein